MIMSSNGAVGLAGRSNCERWVGFESRGGESQELMPPARPGGQRVLVQPRTCPSGPGTNMRGSNHAVGGAVVVPVVHPGPAARRASAIAAATTGPPAASMVKTTFPGVLSEEKSATQYGSAAISTDLTASMSGWVPGVG